ncbi:hypothetical protein DFH28DRAFT_932684 [Melampsora americana]|nr:hypothetical protein DFH28DRAFT_932684 [Melampsora americana]
MTHEVMLHETHNTTLQLLQKFKDKSVGVHELTLRVWLRVRMLYLWALVLHASESFTSKWGSTRELCLYGYGHQFFRKGRQTTINTCFPTFTSIRCVTYHLQANLASIETEKYWPGIRKGRAKPKMHNTHL